LNGANRCVVCEFTEVESPVTVGAQRLGRQPVAQIIFELAPFDAAVAVTKATGVGSAGDRIVARLPSQG
jgi:hypothetical protein